MLSPVSHIEVSLLEDLWTERACHLPSKSFLLSFKRIVLTFLGNIDFEDQLFQEFGEDVFMEKLDP